MDIINAEIASVKCYSEYKYAQRPNVFTFKGKTHKVRKVVSEWREENKNLFVVEDEESKKYILSYEEKEDIWRIKEKKGKIPSTSSGKTVK